MILARSSVFAVALVFAAAALAGSEAQAQQRSIEAQPRPGQPLLPVTRPAIPAADQPPPPMRGSLHIDEPEQQLRWDPRWRKFEVGDAIATGAMAAVAVGALAIPRAEERWTQFNDFDIAVRGAIRPDNQAGRDLARDLSDVMLVLSIDQVLVDSLIVTWWGHGREDIAWQMALMNIEALAFNSAVNTLITSLASRERPYRDMCVGAAAEELEDCRSSNRYRSFYSGHTSTAFTMAGLTCMHHAQQPLYGNAAADALACISGLAIAGTTGTMRIVADQHHTSDVLTGAAMGLFSGLAVPWLLHYRTGDLPDVAESQVKVSFVPTLAGGTIVGEF